MYDFLDRMKDFHRIIEEDNSACYDFSKKIVCLSVVVLVTIGVLYQTTQIEGGKESCISLAMIRSQISNLNHPKVSPLHLATAMPPFLATSTAELP